MRGGGRACPPLSLFGFLFSISHSASCILQAFHSACDHQQHRSHFLELQPDARITASGRLNQFLQALANRRFQTFHLCRQRLSRCFFCKSSARLRCGPCASQAFGRWFDLLQRPFGQMSSCWRCARVILSSRRHTPSLAVTSIAMLVRGNAGPEVTVVADQAAQSRHRSTANSCHENPSRFRRPRSLVGSIGTSMVAGRGNNLKPSSNRAFSPPDKRRTGAACFAPPSKRNSFSDSQPRVSAAAHTRIWSALPDTRISGSPSELSHRVISPSELAGAGLIQTAQSPRWCLVESHRRQACSFSDAAMFGKSGFNPHRWPDQQCGPRAGS